MMTKTLKQRVEAIEKWINDFEEAEKQFMQEEVVFIPPSELFRDRKKDH